MKKYFITVCSILLLTLSSCSNKNEQTDESIYDFVIDDSSKEAQLTASPSYNSTDDKVNYNTEEERKLAEMVFEKSADEILQEDIDSVKTIFIVGKFILPRKLDGTRSPQEGYYYEDKLYSYEEQLGELIQGLSLFKNTQYLYIYFNEDLTDLSFLQYMPSLKTLQIDMSSFTTLDELAQLTQLEELTLGASKVEDISGICSLSQLKSLYITGANITELPDMSELTSLENIGISYNQSEITGFENLNSLSSLTFLSLFNKNMDLTFLENKPESLKELMLGYTDINAKDLLILNDSNVVGLYLQNARLDNIEELTNLDSNIYLDLYNMKELSEEDIDLLKTSIKSVNVRNDDTSILYDWIISNYN